MIQDNYISTLTDYIENSLNSTEYLTFNSSTEYVVSSEESLSDLDTFLFLVIIIMSFLLFIAVYIIYVNYKRESKNDYSSSEIEMEEQCV